MISETRILLKFADDKNWVVVDYSSGGYPSEEANVFKAHNFKTIEKARVYAIGDKKINQKPFVVEFTAKIIN